ncbi:MAG: acyl carrier protein [Thermoprotei archaeon]|nr:acyl carrier protein [Thermoproteales archaeon]RLE84474.1 MAG: acyl carrier protein [Thermoprotei archaeon]RLF03824.1 MAG: acyl carrier protein [Thermoprotei archaeon]
MAKLTREEVEQKVKEVIAEQFGVDPASLKPETRFVEDLGADSLASIELVAAIEEAFDIEVPDEDIEKNQTVGQAIEYVIKKLEEKGALA